MERKAWRDDPVVKRTRCSCRGRVEFPPPTLGESQPPVTPGDPRPSFGLCGQLYLSMLTHTHVHTHTPLKVKIKSLKSIV